MSDPPSPGRADLEFVPPPCSAAVVARLPESARPRLLQLLGALSESIACVVLTTPVGEPIEGGGEQLCGGFVRRVEVVGGSGAEALAAGGRSALADPAPEVLVLVDRELAAWSADEIALVEPATIRSVARLGAVAGWISAGGERLRPGLMLVPSAVWRDLAPAAPELVGDASVARWKAAGVPVVDLRALVRLAELGVGPAEITAGLASGLTRLRDRLAPWSPRLDRRLALDLCSIPETVLEGEPLRLELSGWVAHAPQPASVELRIGDRRIGMPVESARPDVLARYPDLADERCGFRFDRPVSGLAVGRHSLSIGLPGRRASRRIGSVRVVPLRAAGAEARLSVRRASPVPSSERLALTVTSARAVPLTGGGWSLEIVGEICGKPELDSLTLAIDGRVELAVDPRAFEPLAAAPAERERCRFRIETSLAGDVGRRVLSLIARRRRQAVAEWSGAVELPEPGEPRIEWSCPTLERLLRESPAWVHGALVLEGELRGAPSGSELTLEIDGDEVAHSVLDRERRFRLVHRPESTRERAVECVVRAGGVELARRGPITFLARATAVPVSSALHLDRLRGVLTSHLQALEGLPSADLLRALFELRAADRGAIEAALASLVERLLAAEHRPAVIDGELPAVEGDRLRALFVAWEIPWSGHGGGVCMVHLLRYLGARHAVTLLHPVHPGSEWLSEEVRPYVDEIVTVPRGWRPVGRPAPFGVPERLLRTFSAELQAAIAAELDGGGYDLVNYEYFGCTLHAPPRRLPDLLAFYESAVYATLAAAPRRFADEHEAADWLGRLISALHFETVRSAERFARMVALTEPEARLLAPFLPGGRVTVHGIPIDVERLSAQAAAAGRPDRPTFVYVGTFEHPPNLAAARELIEEIAPRLLAVAPAARLLLVGERPPASIEAAAAAAGVECTGWVDDLAHLLGGVTGFLAPIHRGGGMRVKLLEAMACGCPVVTTRLGMSGIDARPDLDYLEAADADQFVAAAQRLIEEATLAERLAAAGRALVARDHLPAVVGDRRERIWRSVVADGARSRPAPADRPAT